MNRLLTLLGIIATVSLSACCTTKTGYGRYTMLADCQTVNIDSVDYQLTVAPNNTELEIAGHTLIRGIDRKTRPWLYVHSMDFATKMADITFEEGSKSTYPLYTGSKAAIFSPYTQPWDIERSTTISFDNDYWLVAHRWDSVGVYFDLQQMNNGDDTDWSLIQADIFVANGATVNVSEIATDITITAFDASNNTATVEFSR